ncbi:hypothetical protein IG631_07874 [Alternaria alternata]|nr:hypothetical protein IG631_07874 [Alternaria alternata]
MGVWKQSRGPVGWLLLAVALRDRRRVWRRTPCRCIYWNPGSSISMWASERNCRLARRRDRRVWLLLNDVSMVPLTGIAQCVKIFLNNTSITNGYSKRAVLSRDSL